MQHVHVEVNVRQEAATSFDALPPELFMRIVAESLCAGAGAAPSFRLVNKTWMGAHDGASRKLRLTLRSSADPDDSAFHPAAVHPLKLPSLLQQFGCLRTLNLVRCPTSGRTSGPTAPRPPRTTCFLAGAGDARVRTRGAPLHRLLRHRGAEVRDPP